MDPVTIALGLAQFAPSILRYFGVGEKPVEVAEKVVGIAQTVTGARTPEGMLEVLRQNGELAHKFNVAVLEADAELEKAYLADRADARSRDVEVRKLTGGTNVRADVMIAGAVMGLIACLVVLLFFRDGVSGEAVGIISTIASVFGLCLRDAFQFEFGSSRGSKQKDELLARLPGAERGR